MNIIHFIEKIFFIEIEFLEKISLPYFLIIYVIDASCICRICKMFNEPVWQALIPFYNWRVIFKYCWNDKAFKEHLILELLNIVIPVIYEELITHEFIELIILIVDLILAIIGFRHSIEIMSYLLESFGYEKKRYKILMFIFDIPLIMCAYGKNKYLYNASLKKK
ncbi:MAG: hypothetical protein IJI66_04550 [Erysipelotrichaceae bacterium]|nr:hypothetical protein [Erysipelotrichaceae bacterium]